MTEYETEIWDVINNPNYTFYKLHVNGKCSFDEFYNEIVNNVANKKSMIAIIAYMDMLSAQLLPRTIYNHIKDNDRHDLYEFKKNNLRVYVIDQRPDIYVVMGGYKKNQKNDIANFKNKVKDFQNK